MTTVLKPLSKAKAVTGESPVWDDRRNCVWWIDIQGQRLIATTIEGQDAWDIPLPSMPGFVALAEDDRLVIGLEDGLWSIIPEKEDARRFASFPLIDARFRANDGKADSRGNLYFGIMDKTGKGEPIGAILRFSAHTGVQTLIEQITTPNAICPKRDGSGFYFADTATGTLAFASVDATTGLVTSRKLIAQFQSNETPDGMVIDVSGELWLAQIGKGRIVHLDSTGAEIGFVETPVTRPTMPAFVGPGLCHMVVTSQRKFLGFEELRDQPTAGQLHIGRFTARGYPACRVRLRPWR